MKNKEKKNEVRVGNYVYGINEKIEYKKIMTYGPSKWMNEDVVIIADELGVRISLGELQRLWEKSKGYYYFDGGINYNENDRSFEIYEYGWKKYFEMREYGLITDTFDDELCNKLNYADAWELIKKYIETARKFTTRHDEYDDQWPARRERKRHIFPDCFIKE